jgi:hypothetical protein
MENRFVFVVEWYDEISSLLKVFKLLFYESDETVELVKLTSLISKNEKCSCVGSKCLTLIEKTFTLEAQFIFLEEK